MTLTKYKKLNEESNQQYVSRVVNAEDKPMNNNDVKTNTLIICLKAICAEAFE
jgi:hypothetical protein